MPSPSRVRNRPSVLTANPAQCLTSGALSASPFPSVEPGAVTLRVSTAPLLWLLGFQFDLRLTMRFIFAFGVGTRAFFVFWCKTQFV